MEHSDFIVVDQRGVWSLVLLMLVGRAMGTHEAGIEGGTTSLRILGAVIMTVAVVLVLV